ncbi:MAG TPA: copper chaperone PCu(A)C [Alphaproteobacteria bacterium]
MRIVALLLCLIAVSASAAPAADIELIQPWVRATPGQRTGALYLTLHNGGSESDRLVAVSTPMAQRAELHSSVEQDNVARMQKIDGIELSPGGSVPLQPGGLHIMLVGLDPTVKPGVSMPVTFRFQRAGDIVIGAPVLAPGAEPPAPSAMGSGGAQGGATGHRAH